MDHLRALARCQCIGPRPIAGQAVVVKGRSRRGGQTPPEQKMAMGLLLGTISFYLFLKVKGLDIYIPPLTEKL